MPRKEGMERADLLKANVSIFKGQGEAIDKHASRNVRVLVVGNPANTNAAVCSHYAPSIPKSNFSALTRLDHNRAVSLVARRLQTPVEAVEGVAIWGNHSGTQFADVTHARAAGRAVLAADEAFFRGEFVKTVQQRGAAVIAARKMSSAASAAQVRIERLLFWCLLTCLPGHLRPRAGLAPGHGRPRGEHGHPLGRVRHCPGPHVFVPGQGGRDGPGARRAGPANRRLLSQDARDHPEGAARRVEHRDSLFALNNHGEQFAH